MAVSAHLSAGPHRCPRINHRAFAHARTDVDKTRHQNDAFFKEAPAAGHGARHKAHARCREVFCGGPGKLQRDLVVISGRACRHQGVGCEAERKEHRLFDPLVRDPIAVDFFGDSERAVIKPCDHGFDGVLKFDCRVFPFASAVPCGVDHADEVLVGHFR